MNDQKNVILAVALSAIVLIAWQYFYGVPQMEKQRQLAQQQQQAQTQPPGAPAQPSGAATPRPEGATPGSTAPTPSGATTSVPGRTSGLEQSREAALAAGPRIQVETPNIRGSIALKGARIDDVALVRFRETVDRTSPAIVLLAPSGTPHPFYAEFGWVGIAGQQIKLPNAETVWRQEGTGALTPGKPVKLVWNNGEGLDFQRTISVDDKFLFTVQDDVVNRGETPVTLYPYGLISRVGTPAVLGYYILHEGMIGVLGDKGLQEVTYAKIEEAKQMPFKVTNAWLGITDKYWAATLLPDPKAAVQAKFSSGTLGAVRTFQTDYLLDPVSIAPGASATTMGRLFAGAKEVNTIDAYDKALDLNRFELLIDWGWFYFITKPLFWVIDWLFQWTHNFGVAILIVTLLIKVVFFPLANKSYASMAKMKAAQPQMTQIRERWADDKVKQQQELMELYKREKINPIAGCWPILIQIPVFFALYKVLFVTIEMRHAPFFGWIKDLSAPDPTTLFNLFGLLPYDPTVVPVIGQLLHVGAWPLLMGITMWIQMQLNPTPPDPTQKMIFDWMPVMFTFMLAGFSAGLVIYWAWNNLLSVIQQAVIMRKNGAKIELLDNFKAMFARRKPQE